MKAYFNPPLGHVLWETYGRIIRRIQELTGGRTWSLRAVPFPDPPTVIYDVWRQDGTFIGTFNQS